MSMMQAGCCCGSCSCECLPSTVSFSASAVSFYVSCCTCDGLNNTGALYLTIPAMSDVTAYGCCDISAPGSEFAFYASNPVFLGTYNLLINGEVFCANSKSVSIYAQVAIGTYQCSSNSWNASVYLWGYYSGGGCSSVLIPLDRSIDPCDITGWTDCLLGCFGPGGIAVSNNRTGNFCSPTGTYTFTPLTHAVNNCETTAAAVDWTLSVT